MTRWRPHSPSPWLDWDSWEWDSWEWEETELAVLREHIDAPRFALERPIAIDPDYQYVPRAESKRNAPILASERKARIERARIVAGVNRSRVLVLARTLRKMVFDADRELVDLTADPQFWTCIGCGRSMRVTPAKPSLYVEHSIPTCPVWVEFARTAFGRNKQEVRP